MKKLIILLTLLTGFIGKAQMPVTDVAAGGQLTTLNASATAQISKMADQLANAGKQLSQLEKSYEEMKKVSDKIEKVNEAVKNYNQLVTFFKMQKQIISNLSAVNSSGSYSASTSKRIQSVLNQTTNSMETLQDVLSNNVFNLNDKERLDLLKQQKEELQINSVRSLMLLNASKR